MSTGNLRTLARLLTPWRTIRRLEDELNAANRLLAVYWRNAERTEVARLRLQNCPTHGQQPTVVEGVYLWATLDGMAGPLPPLPERLAKREQLMITRLQGDPEARC